MTKVIGKFSETVELMEITLKEPVSEQVRVGAVFDLFGTAWSTATVFVESISHDRRTITVRPA